jgi:hypothetical protein
MFKVSLVLQDDADNVEAKVSPGGIGRDRGVKLILQKLHIRMG